MNTTDEMQHPPGVALRLSLRGVMWLTQGLAASGL